MDIDQATENLVKTQVEEIRQLKERVARLEESKKALTGQLVEKNMNPDFFPL